MDLDDSLASVERKFNFVVKNNRTFLKKKITNEGEDELSGLFFDGELHFVGNLEDKEGKSVSWVCICRAMSDSQERKERIFALSHSAFLSALTFNQEILDGFGSGLILDGKAGRRELTDFKLFLLEEYQLTGQRKKYLASSNFGYMGSNYWFLNPKLHIKSKSILAEEDYLYMDCVNHKKISYLNMEHSLLQQATCIDINRRIYASLDFYSTNLEKAQFSIAFALSRLLHLTDDSVLTAGAGEAKVLLLFGEKNTGKTMLQNVLHWGQGGDCIPHELFVAGGNSTTTGTSLTKIQESSNTTTMLLNFNDMVLTDGQADSILQFQEQLLQGSSTRGLSSAHCCGAVISSNFNLPHRLQGRVIKFTFEEVDISSNQTRKAQDCLTLCKEFKGFLLSWVIHFGSLWRKHYVNAREVLCGIIMRNLNAQFRWCNAIALAVYTKCFYVRSLNMECGIVETICHILKSSRDESVKERLTKHLLRKICADKANVLSWLNWKVNITRSGLPDDKALAIPVNVFNNEFCGVSKEGIINESLRNHKPVFCTTVYFAKPNTNADTEAVRKRESNKTESHRAHKIPYNFFDTDIIEWLLAGNFDNQLHLNSGQDLPLSEEDLSAIEKLEADISSSLNSTGVSNDNDTSEYLPNSLCDVVTPKKKQELRVMTPRKRKVFVEAVEYAKVKLLSTKKSYASQSSQTDPKENACNLKGKSLESESSRKSPPPMSPESDNESLGDENSLFPSRVFGAFPCTSTQVHDKSPILLGAPSAPISLRRKSSGKKGFHSTKKRKSTSGPASKGHSDIRLRKNKASAKKRLNYTGKRKSTPKHANKGPTRKQMKEESCCCREKTGELMVECSWEGTPVCPANNWVHVSCAGLQKVPEGKWYCASCRNVNK